MKKLLAYLFLATLPCGAAARDHITMDSTVLHLVDGTSLIEVGQLFLFGKNLSALLRGAKSFEQAHQIAEAFNLTLTHPLEEFNKCTDGVGMIWCVDGYYSIKDLVIAEAEGKFPQADLDAAMDHMANHFEKFSEDYIKEIQVGKEFMVQLIENWSELRGRQDTILLDWSKTDQGEKEMLYKTLTSFKLIDIFVKDLLTFLADLVENCPKSHKKYRDSLKHSEPASTATN